MRYGKIAIGASAICGCMCLFWAALKLPTQIYLSGIQGVEKGIEELFVPGLFLLEAQQPEKSVTDMFLEWTFTPWYYEEARNYIGRNIQTQAAEAYLECILENDSTDYYRLMQEENDQSSKMGKSGEEVEQNGDQEELSGGTVEENGSEVEQGGVKVEQNGAHGGQSAEETTEIRVPAQDEIARQYQYEEGELNDYDQLVKSFYIVDQNTQAGPDILDAETFETMQFSVPKETEEPVIYIYHTHSQEAFCNSREGVKEDTVVGAGAYLTELLTAYGYKVLHDEAVFDGESRDYAYSNALPHLEKVLEEHPSIQVVIDLHRDEMPEETHLVSEVGGKRCARYMFFNGMSLLRDKGEIDTLDNPNKMSNLGFSFQLQKTSNEYYPGLARRIYLKAYRYNLHLRPASVLIELGAQNNTVEEIMNGCEPLAFVLNQVLSER